MQADYHRAVSVECTTPKMMKTTMLMIIEEKRTINKMDQWVPPTALVKIRYIL